MVVCCSGVINNRRLGWTNEEPIQGLGDVPGESSVAKEEIPPMYIFIPWDMWASGASPLIVLQPWVFCTWNKLFLCLGNTFVSADAVFSTWLCHETSAILRRRALQLRNSSGFERSGLISYTVSWRTSHYGSMCSEGTIDSSKIRTCKKSLLVSSL